MKNLKRYIIILLAFVHIQFSYTQIASDSLGCVPLLVKFTSPDQSLQNPVWDFKDGASSDKINPNHVFIQEGTYIVSLKDNGQLISETKIVILPEIIPQIEVDTNQGCAPLSIQFMDQTKLSNNLSVLQYLWDFGDGIGSSLKNPSHTYKTTDYFDVTLNLKINIPQCNVTKTFEDFILINDKQNVDFKIDSITPRCALPAMVHFTYFGINDPGYSYHWTFGNGITSNKVQPDPVEYSKQGIYEVILEVDNNKGCRSKISRFVNISLTTKLEVIIPDTICYESPFSIQNNSIGNKYYWDFGPYASQSIYTLHTPYNVTYNTYGDQSIYFKTTTSDGCIRDTIINVFVEEVDASFKILPDSICSWPQEIRYIANNPYYSSFIWDKIPGNSTYSYMREFISRDSFYYNELDSVVVNLSVITQHGCKADSTNKFFIQIPNSQFDINKFEDEVPFTLIPTDRSESLQPIVTWIYNWGDGTSNTYNAASISNASHTYEYPGEYYVNLTIINEKGCRDDYFGAWVTAHELPRFPEPTQCNASGNGGGITCYNDTIGFVVVNVPSVFDAFHFNFGTAFSQCEKDKQVIFPVREDPGTYQLGVTLENGGNFYSFQSNTPIQIHGAKAKIDYLINCADPLNVHFISQSINSTKVEWLIEDKSISQDNFYYKFPSEGDYIVKLVAINELDGCPSDTAQVLIHLRNPKAVINFTNNWCAGIDNKLISSQSQDAIIGCQTGYLWSFSKSAEKPNIITNLDSIATSLPAGKHEISLEVRDINGCRDTTTVSIDVFSISADFEEDKTAICDSININFKDISKHDAPISQYLWNFDPQNNVPNISHQFTSIPDNSLKVTLRVIDIYGCSSFKEKNFPIYKPTTTLTYDSIVCQTNSGLIIASDFNVYDSYLLYSWTLDDQFISADDSLIYSGLTPGLHKVTLQIKEAGTNCTNQYATNIRVLSTPIPIITGLEDSVYCYPKTLTLSGKESIIDPNDIVFYQWNFGNNRSSSQIEPIETFKKGDFRIQLTLRSIFNCESKITKNISLVGPEGKLVLDKSKICKGENITFTLSESKDVSSFFWDFGQGEIDGNKSPNTYQYNFVPLNGKTFVALILQSKETGCETVLTAPIEIHKVNASFLADSTCEDSIQLVNLSIGGDDISWDLNGNILTKEFNPKIGFGKPGIFPVRLIIHNQAFGCRDTFVSNLIYYPNPVLNISPSIGLCGDNTYSFMTDPTYIFEFEPPGNVQQVDNEIIVSAMKDLALYITATTTDGCTKKEVINIDHNEFETSDFEQDIYICDKNGNIELLLDLNEGDSLAWTLDGVTIQSPLISCTQCPNPTISKEVEGELLALVYNYENCSKKSFVYHLKQTKLEVPNVFSPNNDGINDLFRPASTKPISQEIEILNLKIINRWGKEVFNSMQPWDGMINQNPAPAEVYYYTMTYVIGKYCTQTTKGDVTLMK